MKGLIEGVPRTKHPIYTVWCNMKSRCYNSNNPDFKNYGARGIIVCDRWINSFVNFVEDMGVRPTKLHTIERVNNDGNYEPSNCKWATRAEQINNKRKPKTLSIRKNSTTGIKYIQKCKDGYKVIIPTLDGPNVLGYRLSLIDAKELLESNKELIHECY